MEDDRQGEVARVSNEKSRETKEVIDYYEKQV